MTSMIFSIWSSTNIYGISTGLTYLGGQVLIIWWGQGVLDPGNLPKVQSKLWPILLLDQK